MAACWKFLTVISLSSLFVSSAIAANPVPTYNYSVQFLGVCYSYTHYDQANDSNPQTTLDAMAKDFPLISKKGFKVVRSYQISSQAHYLNFIGEAYRNNLKVIVEVAVDPNFTANNQANINLFNTFLEYVKSTPETKKGQTMKSVIFDGYTYKNVDYVAPSMLKNTVILALAGNENVPSNPKDSASLITLKDGIQGKLSANGFGGIAVSYCLQADVWAGAPAQYPNRRALIESLADGVPFLMNCYPFEWGTPVDQSVDGPAAHSFKFYIDQMKTNYGLLLSKHPIMFGETGWASAGTAGTSSPATLANEATFISKVFGWISKKPGGISGVLLFEAFDESTKPGPAYEANFGLWYGGTPAKEGAYKPGLPAPPSIKTAVVRGGQEYVPDAESAAHAGKNVQGGTQKDTIKLLGFWPSATIQDFCNLGLLVTVDGNTIELPAEGFEEKSAECSYDSKGIKFKFSDDGNWSFSAKTDLEGIDSRDDLLVTLSSGEKSVEFIIDAKEVSKCSFKEGENPVEAVPLTGIPMKTFSVKKANVSFSDKQGLVKIDLSAVFELPEGGAFNKDSDTVVFTCESFERSFEPGSFMQMKEGVYSCRSVDSDGDLEIMLDFNKPLTRIKFILVNGWDLFSIYDGMDCHLKIGTWEGASILAPEYRFSFNYDSSKKR